MIVKWINAFDKDLSKACDTLNPNLWFDRINAYDFLFNAIKSAKSYLLKLFQRVNIKDHFSDWCKILLGVSQGSILGPILFNHFINDIF